MLKGYHHTTTTSSAGSFFGMDPMWDDSALALEQKIFENNKRDYETYLANCIADIKRGKSLAFVQRKFKHKLEFDFVNKLFKENAPDPEQSMKDKTEEIEKAVQTLEEDPILDQRDEYASDRQYLKAILSNDAYMTIPNRRLAAITGIGQTSVGQAKKEFMTDSVDINTQKRNREELRQALFIDQRFEQIRFRTKASMLRAILQCPEYADMEEYDIASVCECSSMEVTNAKNQLIQRQEKEKDINQTKGEIMLASDISRENWIVKLSADPRFKSHLFKNFTARVRAIVQCGDYDGMKQVDIAKVCGCDDSVVRRLTREKRADQPPTLTREQFIAKLRADPRFAPKHFNSISARIRAILQCEDYKNMKQADIAICCECTSAHIAKVQASIHREKQPPINLDSSFSSPYQQFTASTEPEEELDQEDELEDELDQEDELENDQDELEDELVNDQDELDQDELEDEPQLTEKDEALAFWGIVPKTVEKEPMQSNTDAQLVLDKHTKKLFRRVLAKRIAKLKTKLEKLEKIYTDLN